MVWFVALSVAGLLLAAYHSRRAAVVLGVATLVAIAGALVYTQLTARRAFLLISPDAVEIANTAVIPRGNSYVFTGRVINHSAHVLEHMDMRFTLLDCTEQGDELLLSPNAPDCLELASTSKLVYLVLGPGQAASLREFVYFDPPITPQARLLAWRYAILDLRASPADK